ncbi:MAG: YdbH domain-containing protein [Candidatus Accumulibacter sp.]|uniref:intermembrane phospholipid transport protein YdbH family protein n=1 Tax=Accumulibacter sp. TaxID=2053492 RepID=UPI001B2EA8E4|nr:YdbH domain-containing protein [Accumulibacter sp.]MBO3704044.1 YdbH domain-containing protein [Accumulibacter sp.]
MLEPTPAYRRAAPWLLAALLALLVLWLALPRLLGMAAERWLTIPGLQALHVDVDQVGAEDARLREVRAVYQSPGGDRLRIVLRDIAVGYSRPRAQVERLDIGSAELEISPGEATLPASPWPRIEWPVLPWSEVRVGDLRLVLVRSSRSQLDVHGSFLLHQSERKLQAEFRPDGDLLRLTARSPAPQTAGDAPEFHVQWLPAVGPGADARLRVGRQPEEQPARLVAQVPLPLLVELARSLGAALPAATASGTLSLQAEVQFGAASGSVRVLSGEAEVSAGGIELADAAAPLALALAGKARFAWQASAAELVLQPGLRWQATLAGEQPLQASGRLEKSFALRWDDGLAVNAGEFPFALDSPPWGRWQGTLHRLSLGGGDGLGDWRVADGQLRITGRLKDWRGEAIRARDMRLAGDVALHWARSAEVSGELALQLDLGRLSWSGDAPLSVQPARWQVSATAAAKAGGDFWNSLVISGEASSAQMKVKPDSGHALTLASSHLQLLRLRFAGQENGAGSGGGGGAAGAEQARGLAAAEGELRIAADGVRFGGGPAPDLRARLRLKGGALRGDGSLLLQGKEVLAFAGSHRLARGCGEATLNAAQSLPALGKLLQPRPAALQALDLQAGEVDARFTLDWCAPSRSPPRLDARGVLAVRAADLGWDQARAHAVQARLQLDGAHPLRGRLQFSAQDGELASGTPVADLNVDLALAEKALSVHALRVSLLGGSVHSEPLKLPWPPAGETLPLQIRHVDLGQLLALFKVHGLSGSGQIDGLLPLGYGDGGVEIDDGQLSSPGVGTVRYAPTLELPGNPGLLALRNFHFEKLAMRLWYASDGAYRTQATLNGSNPDFYDGYPVRLGLDINGKLPGLFRSAVFSGDFSRHILEQLQSGKLE